MRTLLHEKQPRPRAPKAQDLAAPPRPGRRRPRFPTPAELPFLREEKAREEARLCDVCLFYAQAPQDMGWELLSEDGGYWYFACCFYPQGTPTPPPVAASASPPTPSPDIA